MTDESEQQMNRDAKAMKFNMLYSDFMYLRRLRRMEKQARTDYIG